MGIKIKETEILLGIGDRVLKIVAGPRGENCHLFIDGKEIKGISNIELKMEAGEFTELNISLIPSKSDNIELEI